MSDEVRPHVPADESIVEFSLKAVVLGVVFKAGVKHPLDAGLRFQKFGDFNSC